ncbi:ABC transporter substrate-binding protein [Nostoc linckia z18]|uniref:ABC transporter substrate-binding protein n=2 Tax=Nostoc linckia TaxID=92942 RepID=A0A9Q6EL17_NOSLI|nr:zinc ABC transporter substrate-binding protein [Nostoc linckia]PHK40018.1 ABC transporter substrate-binding protein [Nostoc linckia z15]PHK44778.1 ABC transporter substrate-binding protein [Nostoc linckia z16]PHJ62595.1 ABC transporter substrate-binding protein [Nostoc linckia z1]PHJ72031.1 ABC transporter substrate-binding protein [Nostoc linckia z3]PHJ77999.1 ABC transporter substrate-binding protein [Nostoc linckia z2]
MSKKSPKNNLLRAILVVLTVGFVGCGNQAVRTTFTQTSVEVNENLPRVVATTSLLCDLTRQVAENTVNLTCLISPNANAKIYKPKPEDRKAIEQANLILYTGYNFEPNVIKLIKSTKNSAPKIAVAQAAVSNPQKFIQGGKRVNDPHIWHNTKNAIAMVEVINSNLKKLTSSDAELYTNNTQKITNELTQLDQWIASRIASIPTKQRRLVTTSDAFGYYAKAYGISLAGGMEGISSQEKLTTLRVNNLAKNIKQAKVPTIFPEVAINPNLIQSVATEADVKTSKRQLYSEGLGEPGGEADTYQKMMIANTRTIVEGLGGTYLMFQAK